LRIAPLDVVNDQSDDKDEGGRKQDYWEVIPEQTVQRLASDIFEELECKITNHPKSVISGLTAASRAEAPAGGCVVSVICITTIAVAVESEPASHRNSLNLCSLDNREKSFVMQTPINAAMK